MEELDHPFSELSKTYVILLSWLGQRLAVQIKCSNERNKMTEVLLR